MPNHATREWSRTSPAVRNVLGRPPMLENEDVVRVILEVLAKGHTRKMAAAAARVNPQTLAAWLRAGRDPEAPQLYHDFALAVAAAESRPAGMAVDALVAAFATDWRAAHAYLKSRVSEFKSTPKTALTVTSEVVIKSLTATVSANDV